MLPPYSNKEPRVNDDFVKDARQLLSVPRPHSYGSLASSFSTADPGSRGKANSDSQLVEDESEDVWSGWSQYSASDFDVTVDIHSGHRATQLKFWSWRRPHMRAFHASWILYFFNFMLQFSMAPLFVPISQTLQLSKAQIWRTNIWMMVGGIPMRFLLGPLCDQYGARTIMTLVLGACAMPGIMSWSIVNLTTLTLMRFWLGAADTFVPQQYWMTCLFVRDAMGSTAMAVTSGLGSSGSTCAQILLGCFLYPLFLHWTNSVDLSWRLSLVIPSVIAVGAAYYFYRYSDDTPLGNMSELPGLVVERTATESFRRGVCNLNAWILLVQYAASCGVDFTMCNGTALYYHSQYPQLSVASIAGVAGLYSLAASYARGLGGYLSDTLSKQNSGPGSVRSRLCAQLICLLLQGLCNVVLAEMESSLAVNLIVLVVFSVLVQMSMGTIFGIVPYIDENNIGSVAGVVGAGGNVGAVLFAFIFVEYDYKTAMLIMGGCTIVAALMTPLIVIKGHHGLLWHGRNTDLFSSKPPRTLMVVARSPHFSTLRPHGSRPPHQ